MKYGPKKMKWYVETLSEMVKERKGKLDPFLVPQIQITAQTWRMVDRIAESLEDEDLTSIEIGSQGQQKTVVHPLLAQYDKANRTLMDQFAALGLNYNASQNKVAEAGAADETNDPLAAVMNWKE